jgi:ribonuclease VapC
MVLDTSAIIATVTNEPDGERYRAAMLSMSAVAVLEAKIVLSARFGAAAVTFFEELLESAGIVVVPFDTEMVKAAFEAFQRFGKGRRASGATQDHRLCGLRSGQSAFATAALQRSRFCRDGCRSGLELTCAVISRQAGKAIICLSERAKAESLPSF